MADGAVRQRTIRGRRRALAPLLAAVAPGALGTAAAEASLLDRGAELLTLGPHDAIGLSLLLGLTIFATTTALLHLHERTRWARRERALNNEIASLRGAHDRAELLIGSERQLVVSWSGRDAEPTFEGDPTVVGEAANARRALAFGSWLSSSDAGALEKAIERLRERGEGFHLTLRTLRQRFVEAEGRTVSGRALLRLRDVTGDRLEVMRLMRELARSEDELKSFKGLLDAVPQPAWLRAADGSLSWGNRAYLKAVEAEDLADAQARGLELLDRGDRDEAARKRAAGGVFAARVAAVVAGARRMLDVTESATPGTSPATSLGGSAGIAVDVSELERVRTDLQRQMDAHARTLDQLPTAVAIFDAKQRLAFHNAAYRQLWGLDQAFLDSGPSDGEILDRLRAARKLPEQADFRTWKAGQLAAYRAVEPQEGWWHLPDRRTLRVIANPNPQGGLTYLFDDVTERVHLEQLYNSLIRVQRETLDALNEGVAVFGTDARLKLSNRAFADLWRLAPETLAGEPHIDHFIRGAHALAPADQPWTEIRGAVAGLPETRTGLACRIERRDGTVIDCNAQPLPDGATLLTFVDVTASVNVERALTDRNEALERASQLREDFVHHVSYELRSPLTTIIGFTQLLGDGTVGSLNPRQREYADHIMRSSGALLAIINDILDLASIDTGSLELAREEVDIRQTIADAARGIEDRLAESSVRLDIDAPGDIGSFTADGKRIRQILFNLLSNAVGFSAPGQAVRVTARKEGGDVVLSVHDDGRGIPPEVREKVFERFETHTLGTRHRGVGLGLSIVRSFVELHGGRIELDSQPGSGTTVTCVFPADGAPQRLAAE
ncbi:MAG TPA: PAS-domain containing protein [Beijerinckiaceae bacterium]|jgi:signal transduction histidine kinase